MRYVRARCSDSTRPLERSCCALLSRFLRDSSQSDGRRLARWGKCGAMSRQGDSSCTPHSACDGEVSIGGTEHGWPMTERRILAWPDAVCPSH